MAVELKKLYGGEGIPGPYNNVHHFPLVNKDDGFVNMEVICSKMDKGAVGKSHSHPGKEHVMIVYEGSLRINTPDGKHYDILPGNALLMKPGEEHEVVNTNDGETHYMVIYSPPR